jgi:hypothetical protein
MLTRRILILALLSFVLTLPASAQPAEILLTITEPILGQWLFDGRGTQAVTVGPGHPLNFSWTADAGAGMVTGYRYGWDVVDVADPNDPGWAADWQPDLLSAPTHSFEVGVHSLAVTVRGDLDRVTTATIVITVDPSVPARRMSWGRLKSSS